jgi:hypothetical protein
MSLTPLTLLLLACTTDPGTSSKGDDTDVADTDVVDTDLPVDSDRPDPWSFSAHPCAGNRTDTMLVLPNGSIWVGCGTTTNGTGLFVSADGGETWGAPPTTPDDYFRQFRVDDLSLATDGLLYVAGDYTGSGGRSADAVVALDPTQDPSLVLSVFEVGNQTWNSFQAGTFRRLPSGRSVAESLTGNAVVWRDADADPWQDGYGWWPPGDSFQILDMEVWDDALYACGSTISQPPHVFLPSANTDGFHLDPIVLADFDGELWDIVADEQGVWVGGVDQDADVGVAFVSGADPHDPADWSAVELPALARTESTWFEGLCRRGDSWAIVGRYSQTSDALVLWSEDAGATWQEISPDGVPSISVCHVAADGRLLVTGAEGVVGWYDPALAE